MAELTINAADIAAALRKHVDSYTPTLAAERVQSALEDISAEIQVDISLTPAG